MSSLSNIGFRGLREGAWRARWRDFAWGPAPGEQRGVRGGRRGAACFISIDVAASRSRDRDSRRGASRPRPASGDRPLTPALSPSGEEGVEERLFLYADLAATVSIARRRLAR